MTWKLPEHLEPYREYIEYNSIDFNSIEEIMNLNKGHVTLDEEVVDSQIDLLQRLYDAGALKKPDCKHEDLEKPEDDGMRRCKNCGLYTKTIDAGKLK